MDYLNSRSRLDKLDQPMSLGGKARSGTISSKWISIAVGLMIAVVAYTFHLSLELRLDRLEVFDQNNVIFDADPNEVLSSLADGGLIAFAGPNWDHRRGLVHPNLGNFFAIPIRAFAKSLFIISPDELDEWYLRRQLALLIVPLSAALFYLVFHRLLLRLKFSLLLASLFTLLVFVSFSQMLFGSIPESYAISNFAIILAYLLFVIFRGRRGLPRFIAWAAVGVFATGVTITNIVPVIIFFWLSEIYNRSRFAVSIVKASGMAVFILAFTLALNVMSNYAAGVEPRSLGQEANWIRFFGSGNTQVISRRFLTFPAVLVNSIIAPVPKQQPNEYALRMNPEARYSFQFTFDYDEGRGSTTPLLSPRNLAGIVLFLLLLLPIRALPIEFLQKKLPQTQIRVSFRFPAIVPRAIIIVGGAMMVGAFLVDWLGLGGGAGFGAKQLILFSAGCFLVLSGWLLPRVKNIGLVLSRWLRPYVKEIRGLDNPDRSLLLLSWGSLLIIGFNWGLHSFWGLDRFLYSQHWHVSLMFLLAVFVVTQLHSARTRIVLVAVSVIVVAVNNLVVLRTIFMVLWAN